MWTDSATEDNGEEGTAYLMGSRVNVRCPMESIDNVEWGPNRVR
ncbi:hypothetical protein ABZ540_20560 [Nocardia xishanensis]